MQQVELRSALAVETGRLGIDDRMTFDPRRLLDNASLCRVYSAVADMNLKAVAVMLQFM